MAGYLINRADATDKVFLVAALKKHFHTCTDEMSGEYLSLYVPLPVRRLATGDFNVSWTEHVFNRSKISWTSIHADKA